MGTQGRVMFLQLEQFMANGLNPKIHKKRRNLSKQLPTAPRNEQRDSIPVTITETHYTSQTTNPPSESSSICTEYVWIPVEESKVHSIMKHDNSDEEYEFVSFH